MDPLTRHCCIGYGIERGIVEANAHTVDGVAHFGVAGALVDEVMADTYRREVDMLIADLEALSAAMMVTDRQLARGDSHRLAVRLDSLAKSIEQTRLDQRIEAASAAGWTADYRQGGRPIPEPQDGMTDDELDAIDRARADAKRVYEAKRGHAAAGHYIEPDDVPPAPDLGASFEGGDGESIGAMTDSDELDPDDEIQP